MADDELIYTKIGIDQAGDIVGRLMSACVCGPLDPDDACLSCCARTEIERLRAVLDAINALHFPLQSMGTRRECAADGDDWPCPTHLLIHPKEARRG